MKLYLDSFDVESWKEWMPSGLFYGITTNPILAERAGLFYPSINWSSKMALAEKLNVKEFIFSCQVAMKRQLVLQRSEKKKRKILILTL